MPSLLLDAVFAQETGAEDAVPCVDLVAHPWLCHYLKAAPGTHAEVSLQGCERSAMRFLDASCAHLHFCYHSHCNYRHWDSVSAAASAGSEGLGTFHNVGEWHSNEKGALGPASVNVAALARMLPLLMGPHAAALLPSASASPSPGSPFRSSSTGHTSMIAVNALDSTILFEVMLEAGPAGDVCGGGATGGQAGQAAEADVPMSPVWLVSPTVDIRALQQLCSIKQQEQQAAHGQLHTRNTAPLPTLCLRTQRLVTRLLGWVAETPALAAKQFSSLLLTGSAGSGKSLVLQAFEAQLQDRGHGVFVLTPSLVAAHRPGNAGVPPAALDSAARPRQLALRLLSLAGMSLNEERTASKIIIMLDDVDTFLYALDAEGSRSTSGSSFLLGTSDASVLTALQGFSYCLRNLLASLSNAYLREGACDVFVLGSSRMAPEQVYRSSDPTTLPRFSRITALPALQVADRGVILTACLKDLGHVNTDPAILHRAAAVCNTYQPADLVRVADTAARLADSSAASAAKTADAVISTECKSRVGEFLLEACVAVSPIGMREFDNLLSGLGVSTAAAEQLRWSDFGGYAAIVADIQRYLRRGKGLRGLVLHGPSGCGKSYLARVIASELRRAHVDVDSPDADTDASIGTAAAEAGGLGNGARSYNFVSIKSTDLLSKYFGQTEEAVRAVFANARANAPCVLFFDDFEALACRRAMTGSVEAGAGSSAHDLEARVLSTFLNELDGVAAGTHGRGRDWCGEESAPVEESLVVIVACTHLASLDDALIRPGRLSHHYHLGWPTVSDCVQILAQKLENMPAVIADSTSAKRTDAADMDAVFPLDIVSRLAMDAIERDHEMTADSSGAVSEGGEGEGGAGEHRCRGVSGASIALLCQQAVLSAAREVIQGLISADTNADPAQLDTSTYRVLQRHFDEFLPPVQVSGPNAMATEAPLAPFVFNGAPFSLQGK